MLITETINVGGFDFIHNYSDSGFYIQKVGTLEMYAGAYDPIKYKDERKYVETSVLIEIDEALDPDGREMQTSDTDSSSGV